MEPYSTSAFKIFAWIFATFTKICTFQQSIWIHIHSQILKTPIYTLIKRFINGKISVLYLSVIHFRGFRIRQVSCYTLLSGYRLPWSPSWCLYTNTPFMVSLSIKLDTLILLLVHPKSPVLLTKTSPLKYKECSFIRSLRIGWGLNNPQHLFTMSRSNQISYLYFAILRETSIGTSY